MSFFSSCSDMVSLPFSILVCVAFVLGVGVLPLAVVKSKMAVPVAVAATALAVVPIVVGAVYTARGYEEARAFAARSPKNPDGPDSIRVIARRCTYFGLELAAVPLAGAALAVALVLVRRRSAPPASSRSI